VNASSASEFAGLPIALLGQKLEIINENLMFVEQKTVSYNNPQNDIKSLNNVMRSSALTPSDLTFTVSIYRPYPYSPTDKSIIAYANYDWIISPWWTLTDCIGLTWDNNIWYPLEGSQMATNYFSDNGNVSSEYYSSVPYASPMGIGWDLDIKQSADGIFRNYGYCRITLVAYNPQNVGTTQLFGKYFHVEGIGSIGLTLGVFTVYFAGSSANTSIANWLTFTY
jgi:hypothetical protein